MLNRGALGRVPISILLVLTCGFCWSTYAALIAYDGFNYPMGQTVVGQNGGTGWSGGYAQNVGNSAAAYSEVSDIASSFPNLSSSGNQLHLNGTSAPGGSEGVYRNLASSYSTAGNVYWISVLLQIDNGVSASYAGVSLFSGTTEDFFFGQRNGSSTWGFEQHAGADASSSVSAASSADGLLVVELDGNTHMASLFINPTSLGGSAPNTADRTLTFTDFTFNRIRAQAGNENLDVDELRFGTTYADVTPVPEGATVLPAVLVLVIAVIVERRWKQYRAV